MTTQEQIEKLRKDIELLNAALIVMRKHGIGCTAIVADSVVDLTCNLAELEKQADDPWKEAKKRVDFWHENFDADTIQMKVVAYVRHLENSLANRPVVWCVRSEITRNYYRLHNEIALFATYEQARSWPGVPSDLTVEQYTGEQQ